MLEITSIEMMNGEENGNLLSSERILADFQGRWITSDGSRWFFCFWNYFFIPHPTLLRIQLFISPFGETGNWSQWRAENLEGWQLPLRYIVGPAWLRDRCPAYGWYHMCFLVAGQ